MKLYAMEILSQFVLNSQQGKVLCEQMFLKSEDQYGMIVHLNMVFEQFDQIDKPDTTMSNEQ